MRDLFFNTPARLKFLKSPATELAAIVRVVDAAGAGAIPGVHLRLLANGRALLNAPAGAGLRERVGALYGFGLAARLLAVTGEDGGAHVAGVIAPPALSRAHRDDIDFIVNGRLVRDTLLTQALLEAYRPLLPRDQFPLAVIELAVDPGEVDVNVHPTKAWVRFRRPRVLYGVVLDAVKAALRQLDAAPAGLSTRLAGSDAEMAGGAVLPAPGTGLAAPDWGGADPGQASLFREGETGYRSEPFFGRVVGQIQDTFIVAHTADEVFFVDQHVAHERVLFERLRGELDRGTLASQELLFPQPLELAPARLRALERVQPRSSAWASRSRDSAEARSSCAECPRSSGPTSPAARRRARAGARRGHGAGELSGARPAARVRRVPRRDQGPPAARAGGDGAGPHRPRGDRDALLLSARPADRLADPAGGDQARASPDLVTAVFPDPESASPRIPLLAILGPTGVGKTAWPWRSPSAGRSRW